MVSSDYFTATMSGGSTRRRPREKKRAELLATLDTRWEVRMRAVKSDRT